MMRVIFHDLARKEFLDTRDYYDDFVFGLGKLFVEEVEKCLSIIKSYPLSYPILKDNIRKAVVLKFPYSILYRYEKNIIYVLAVMHQKRKPNYWSSRI